MPAPRPPSRPSAGAKTAAGQSSQRAAGWLRTSSDQPAEKILGRLVLDEMMGQDAGRLAAVALPRRRACRCPTSPASAAASPTKPRPALPGDEIDMDIGLEHARTPATPRAGLDPRDRTDAAHRRAAAESGRRSGSTAAPGRRARGPRTAPRAASAPRAARRRFPTGCRVGREFAFLAAGRMVGVAPAVLQHRDTAPGQRRSSRAASARSALLAGITASATGTVAGDRQQVGRGAGEGAAASSSRHHSVAILPCFPPAIQFCGQIGPLRRSPPRGC